MNEIQKYLIKLHLPIFILTILLLGFNGFNLIVLASFLITYVLTYLVGLNMVHRAISHGQFKLQENFYIIFGYLSLFCMLSDPVSFSKTHRYHHKYSDTDLDIHSPKHGKFRSFIGWMWDKDSPKIPPQIIRDLLKNNSLQFLLRYQIRLIWSTLILIGLLSTNVLIGILISMCITFFLEMASNTFLTHNEHGVKDNSLYAWATLSSYHPDHHDDSEIIKNRDPALFLINFLKSIKVIY